ncbi:hypothetical protein [Candidatus Manganitrophus noduliformans]|uniref:Uncharacterized protein n=1 Tax=Candidatus Manganitrophus noduliformans TaxID=2606439 RepID=A0A7X6DS80_9BACT|nr:hypothetical protein [Candidatus Manganitrophus noduliformans]NKE72375.1 hypothetical protein [Candidatus Manganitrophus noduliformans]
MTDIVTISSMLSSIKTASDIAKFFRDTDLSFEKAEQKLKLAELISALADTKMQVAEIQDLISTKDKKIKELEEAIEIKAKLKWEAPYYWLVDKEKDGPFCQQCYDKDSELIHLQGNGEGYWNCKTCKNHYTDSRYKQDFTSVVESKFDPW